MQRKNGRIPNNEGWLRLEHMHESIRKYDLVAMHERACRAAIVLHRQLREISALMGEDVSIPLHKRKPIPPTAENIRKAAEIIGVSVGWLTTGIPETATDMLVLGHRPETLHHLGE